MPLPTVGDAAALLAPGARFVGPRPPPTLALSCSGSELLAAFGTAQIGARRPRWTDDKVLRKDVWRRLGVADAFLVPTLCSTELRLVGELPAPEFYEDDDGGFSPNLDGPIPVQEPSDPHFAEALRDALRRHRRIVLKPSRGANSRGVLLLAAGADDGEVVLSTPDKAADAEVGNATSAATRLPFEQFWRERVVQNRELRPSGDASVVLVEPQVSHDQEVCVFAINGGRLCVVAGRSVCMERIVSLGGGALAVAPSDFGPLTWPEYRSCRQWQQDDEPTRRRNTARALGQRAAGGGGRSVAQVLVDVSRALASRYFEAGAEGGAEDIGGGGEAAAIRLDFFVAWAADGDEGAEATVKLNEVECGFNATCLLGWYGTDLTELAVRFWQRGGGASAPDST